MFLGDPPISKREFLAYSARIAPVVLPYLEGRALNLRRHPNGAQRKGFWHKQLPDHAPHWLGRWDNPEAEEGETTTYLVADEPAALVCGELRRAGVAPLDVTNRGHAPAQLCPARPGPRSARVDVTRLLDPPCAELAGRLGHDAGRCHRLPGSTPGRSRRMMWPMAGLTRRSDDGSDVGSVDPARRRDIADDAVSPGQIGARGWWLVLRRAAGHVVVARLPLLSAGIAFFAVLSIAPVLVTALSVYGAVNTPAQALDQLSRVSQMLPAQLQPIVADQLTSITTASTKVLTLRGLAGLGIALWTAATAWSPSSMC